MESSRRTERRSSPHTMNYIRLLRSQFVNPQRAEENATRERENYLEREDSSEEEESGSPRVSNEFDRVQYIATDREDFLRYLSEIAYLRYRRLYSDVSEEENNNNDNKIYLNDNEIDYRTYPLNIDWSAIENDKKDYYNIFDKYGYFGVAIYCSLQKIPEIKMETNNFLSSFLEYFSKIYKSNNIILLNEYIKSLPSIKMIKEIITSNKYLKKEICVYLLILKVYEIYFLMHGMPYNQSEFSDALYSMFYICNNSSEEVWDKAYDQIKDDDKVESTLKELNSKLYKKKDKYISHLKNLKKLIVSISDGLTKDNFVL